MSKPISLSPSEAICLDALRSGVDRKMLIALHGKLTLKQTGMALERLATLGIAETKGGRQWCLTRRGLGADISIGPAAPRRGPKPNAPGALGHTAQRLLDLLHHPRRSTELAPLLGVTRQRIHQIVVTLSVLGLVRSAEPDRPSSVIARTEDPSVLLRQDQERVLSAFPDGDATTLAKIGGVTPIPPALVATIAHSLIDAGLIEKADSTHRHDVYRLTAAGLAHWQRSATARRADSPPSPFRSDRVRRVLSHLAGQGATRTRDIGVQLDIPQPSINALMQYLKRRRAVRTETAVHNAPYVLTSEGHKMLAAMEQAVAAET